MADASWVTVLLLKKLVQNLSAIHYVDESTVWCCIPLDLRVEALATAALVQAIREAQEHSADSVLYEQWSFSHMEKKIKRKSWGDFKHIDSRYALKLCASGFPPKSAGGVLLPKSAVKFERYLMGEILSVGTNVGQVEAGKNLLSHPFIKKYENTDVDLSAYVKSVVDPTQRLKNIADVHRVLIDIVSAAANATPGLGRYPPFKREVIVIASAALEGFKNEAKKMVVAFVDMERAFVPPQHFIRLVQRRMERQCREEELKTRSSKKGQEAEQSILNRATSPQPGSEQAGGSLKSMKEKSGQQDKDAKEGSNLQVAGPAGEITAGLIIWRE
ncbi:Dynamin-2A [Ananas comosus]|uniref:Dynamin-2A n=1 Tax=Ananas comosus TaxID=4615 RepID=A0A199UEB5_ANACO|nr:Dynamin-2A [Ananas comosus]